MNRKRFKFENLQIWQRAMDFAENLNVLTNNFPKKERFNLSTQMLRAVDSVALNISEGSIGRSNPELRKFIGYSMRSLAEVVTCLFKAKRRKYISKEEFDKHYEEAFNIMNMM